MCVIKTSRVVQVVSGHNKLKHISVFSARRPNNHLQEKRPRPPSSCAQRMGGGVEVKESVSAIVLVLEVWGRDGAGRVPDGGMTL